MASNSKSGGTYFGKPPGTPFDLPGKYYVPGEGFKSYPGGSAMQPTSVYGGGVSTGGVSTGGVAGGGGVSQAELDAMRKMAEAQRKAAELKAIQDKAAQDKAARDKLIRDIEATKKTAVPDYLLGTQFGRGYIPTAEDIKKRFGEARGYISGAKPLPYSAPPEMLEERKQQLAAALQEGKEVYYHPQGAEVITKVWQPAKGAEGYGGGFGGGYVWKDEAGRIVGEEMKVLQASSEKVNIPYVKAKEDVYGVYNAVNEQMREVYTEPLFKGIQKVTGFDITSREGAVAIAPSIIGIGPYGIGKEFTGGLSAGILKDIREKPLKQVITYGAGYGLGFGVSAAVGVAGKSFIGGGPKTAAMFKDLFSLGGVLMTGKYAADLGMDIATSKDLFEMGSKTGVAVKDVYLLGAGAMKGEKGYQKVAGYIATRGREEVPFSKLTTKEVLSGDERFLLISKEKQLASFREGKFAEAIKEPPGGFHTAPERFPINLLLEPKAGTSELPGLYTAPGVSPAFLKIKGGYGKIGDVSLFDISLAASEPGIAFLEPLGFREVGFRRIKPYQIAGEGKFFDYAFKKEAKLGMADIPKMKAEAEAIFRTDAGTYEFKSGKYYTTINDVRVPIDVFKFSAEKVLSGDTFAGRISKGYSYSGIKEPSLITPESLGVSLSISKAAIKPSSLISESKISSYISKISSAVSSASGISKPSYAISRVSYAPSKVSSKVSDISSAVSKISNIISKYSGVSKYYPPSRPPYRPPYYPPYYPPSRPPYRPPYYPPYYPPGRPPYKPPIVPKLDLGISKKDLGMKGFDVFVIKKKKPVVIAKGLYKAAALDVGTKEILKDLKATFGIRKSEMFARDISTGREFERYGQLLRRPTKKSPYRKYGDVYIQKQTRTDIGTGRLTTKGERKSIQEERINKIANMIK